MTSWHGAMQTELRKLAAVLRKKADEYDQTKMVKCAQIINSAVALRLLASKIGRS